MRHLVYRVQALPQSLLPLVWDFGTLTKEREYIEQMICKVVCALLIQLITQNSCSSRFTESIYMLIHLEWICKEYDIIYTYITRINILRAFNNVGNH